MFHSGTDSTWHAVVKLVTLQNLTWRFVVNAAAYGVHFR